MADVKASVFTELERSTLLQALKMKIASLDRAASGYALGSSMYLAVREDILAAKKLFDKIGGM